MHSGSRSSEHPPFSQARLMHREHSEGLRRGSAECAPQSKCSSAACFHRQCWGTQAASGAQTPLGEHRGTELYPFTPLLTVRGRTCAPGQRWGFMTWTLTTSNALNTSSRALYGRHLPNAGGECKQRNALRAKTRWQHPRLPPRGHGFLAILLSELPCLQWDPAPLRLHRSAVRRVTQTRSESDSSS